MFSLLLLNKILIFFVNVLKSLYFCFAGIDPAMKYNLPNVILRLFMKESRV